MTWKEFKEQVEAQGVKDDDELTFIDVTSSIGEPEIRVAIVEWANDTRHVEILG